MSSSNSLTFLSKRSKDFFMSRFSKKKQKNDDSNLNKSIIKIFKTIFILTALTTSNEILYIVLLKSDIFIFTMYIKAVKDSIWKKM